MTLKTSQISSLRRKVAKKLQPLPTLNLSQKNLKQPLLMKRKRSLKRSNSLLNKIPQKNTKVTRMLRRLLTLTWELVRSRISRML